MHTARTVLELDDNKLLSSLDGIGAYDHIKRKAMFSRLNELPRAREMLPFLMMLYGRTSRYLYFLKTAKFARICKGTAASKEVRCRSCSH